VLETEIETGPCRELGEHLLACLEIAEVGVRPRPSRLHDPIDVRDRKRMEQRGVREAENRGRGSDAERKGEHRRHDEHRRVRPQPNR
jgi:hypothetical protein